MVAGSLEIQMLANLARLQQDMNQAKTVVGGAVRDMSRNIDELKSLLGTLGVGLSAGYFGSLIKGTIDSLDHLNDLSKTVKLTVEELAGLRMAAKQSGSDLDGTAAAIAKLSQNIGKEPEKFRLLGITAKEPLEAFKQLADLFTQLQDPTQRAAVLASSLGKSWQSAAPLLSEGSKKIGEMIERGAKLSGVTADMAKNADDLNDKIIELTGSGGAMVRMVGPLLPFLNSVADELIRSRDGADGLTSSFNPLIETLKVLLIIGSDIKFIFTTIGKDIAAFIENVQLAARGQFGEIRKINQLFRDEAKRSREELDEWQKKVMQIGTANDPFRKPPTTWHGTETKSPEQLKAEREAAARAAAFLGTNQKMNDSYDALTKKIKEQTAEQQFELAGREKLTESEKLALKAMVDLRDGVLVLDDAKKRELRTNLEAMLSTDQLLKRRKEELEMSKVLIENLEKEISERERLADIVTQFRVTQNQLVRDIEFETQLLRMEQEGARGMLLTKEEEIRLTGEINTKREIAIGLRRIDMDLARQIASIGDLESAEAQKRVAELEAIAEAQRKALPDAVKAREAQRVTNDLTRQQTADFKEMWSVVEQTGKSVFNMIFASGKGAMEGIGKAIKASIIDVLYQLTARKWIINIGASISNALGLGGITGAGGAGGDGGGSGLGIGNIFSGVNSMMGNGISSMFGASDFTAALAGDAFMPAMLGAEGLGAAGLGSSLGAGLAAIPGWGWAAAGALALLGGDLFGGGGGPKPGEAFFTNANGYFQIGLDNIPDRNDGPNAALANSYISAFNDPEKYDQAKLLQFVGRRVSSPTAQQGVDTILQMLQSAQRLPPEKDQKTISNLGALVQQLRQTYDTEKGRVEGDVGQWQGTAKSLREYASTLTSLPGGLSYTAARDQFNSLALSAIGGDVDAAGSLQGAGETFRQASLSRASTRLDYARDVARIKSTVGGVAGVFESEASIALQQLDALKSQVEELIDIKETVLTVSQALAALQEGAAAAQITADESARDTKSLKDFIQGVITGNISIMTRTTA